MIQKHQYDFRIRRDGDRGYAILAILVAIGLWWWLQSSGDVQAMSHAYQDPAGFAASPQHKSYGSVSYVALTIAFKLLSGFITAVAMIISGIWAVLWDLWTCVRLLVADWRANKEQSRDEERLVMQSIDQNKEPSNNPQRSFDDFSTDEKIKAIGQDSRARVKSLETKMDAGFAELKNLLTPATKSKSKEDSDVSDN